MARARGSSINELEPDIIGDMTTELYACQNSLRSSLSHLDESVSQEVNELEGPFPTMNFKRDLSISQSGENAEKILRPRVGEAQNDLDSYEEGLGQLESNEDADFPSVTSLKRELSVKSMQTSDATPAARRCTHENGRSSPGIFPPARGSRVRFTSDTSNHERDSIADTNLVAEASESNAELLAGIASLDCAGSRVQ